jgi:hypothetical protein
MGENAIKSSINISFLSYNCIMVLFLENKYKSAHDKKTSSLQRTPEWSEKIFLPIFSEN